jgi:hypothetical protein
MDWLPSASPAPRSSRLTAAGASCSNGPATITIDHHARKVLIVMLSLQLGRFADLPDALRPGDHTGRIKARATFEELWPVLDGLDFWENNDPAATYTIPASGWLRALVTQSAADIRQTIAVGTVQANDTARGDQAAFETGGSHHEPRLDVDGCVRQGGYFEGIRECLEQQRDQLLCVEAMLGPR